MTTQFYGQNIASTMTTQFYRQFGDAAKHVDTPHEPRTLDALPYELLDRICKFLGCEDIPRVRQTCRDLAFWTSSQLRFGYNLGGTEEKTVWFTRASLTRALNDLTFQPRSMDHRSNTRFTLCHKIRSERPPSQRDERIMMLSSDGPSTLKLDDTVPDLYRGSELSLCASRPMHAQSTAAYEAENGSFASNLALLTRIFTTMAARGQGLREMRFSVQLDSNLAGYYDVAGELHDIRPADDCDDCDCVYDASLPAVWRAAEEVFRAGMAAIATSGIRVKQVNAFTDESACAIPTPVLIECFDTITPGSVEAVSARLSLPCKTFEERQRERLAKTAVDMESDMESGANEFQVPRPGPGKPGVDMLPVSMMDSAVHPPDVIKAYAALGRRMDARDEAAKRERLMEKDTDRVLEALQSSSGTVLARLKWADLEYMDIGRHASTDQPEAERTVFSPDAVSQKDGPARRLSLTGFHVATHRLQETLPSLRLSELGLRLLTISDEDRASLPIWLRNDSQAPARSDILALSTRSNTVPKPLISPVATEEEADAYRDALAAAPPVAPSSDKVYYSFTHIEHNVTHGAPFNAWLAHDYHLDSETQTEVAMAYSRDAIGCLQANLCIPSRIGHAPGLPPIQYSFWLARGARRCCGFCSVPDMGYRQWRHDQEPATDPPGPVHRFRDRFNTTFLCPYNIVALGFQALALESPQYWAGVRAKREALGED